MPASHSNPVFQSDQGHWLTNKLFLELSYDDERYVLYTLKDQDYRGLPSLRRLYMEAADPTEYYVSQKYFAGWAHWMKIVDTVKLRPIIEQIRLELQTKLRADALNRLIEDSKSSSRSAASSNKYLLDKWTPKEAKVGRPSKQAIKDQARDLAEAQSVYDDDYARILGSGKAVN